MKLPIIQFNFKNPIENQRSDIQVFINKSQEALGSTELAKADLSQPYTLLGLVLKIKEKNGREDFFKDNNSWILIVINLHRAYEKLLFIGEAY